MRVEFKKQKREKNGKGRNKYEENFKNWKNKNWEWKKTVELKGKHKK